MKKRHKKIENNKQQIIDKKGCEEAIKMGEEILKKIDEALKKVDGNKKFLV